MKLDSRVIVAVATLALTACGSVQSGGNDAAGHGASGGSSSGAGGQGRGGTGGSAGSGGGTAGALGGTGGANDARGGAGGAAGAGGVGGSTGSAGRGGSTGSAGGGGTSGGSAGRGGTGGTGGRNSCQGDADCQGFKCCGGFCVNVGNDIFNCGTCGNTCSGAHPHCAEGTCRSGWPCTLVGATCQDAPTCCGTQCCTGTQICCTVTLGPTVTRCFEPVNGTCPIGCADCNCAAPTTPIATPVGDRAIADLKIGDLVYSIDRGSLAVVPIKSVHRQPVSGSHRVVELRLAHGVTLRISPRHPTADGRRLDDLTPGDFVDGVRVIGARLVDYDQPFTHDILPDSDSGAYFAGGTLIGSTLSHGVGELRMSATSAAGSVRRASLATRVQR